MTDFDCERYHDINDYIRLIAILRAPDGCPWDRAQTHRSIRRNCLEEAYEVCEAIDEDDPDHLKEELGDLLMQIIFHAGIEADAGRFDFNDICDASCRKLINRHPHVFGDREANRGAEAAEVWEKAKRAEHGQASTADAIDGVARTLPSLWRAQKMLKKAAAAETVPADDLAQCASAFADAQAEDAERLFGKLILSAAAAAAKKGIDAETAAQRGCDAFAADYRETEEKNPNLEDMRHE
ncbi:MAG TPA: MazG family protein [Oscillospiraceae bacterium]|nr:MazG family protein [Oscillospiraceae bacterium]HPS75839.1 MazG family protein [Oscillospiraceae bacterium]